MIERHRACELPLLDRTDEPAGPTQDSSFVAKSPNELAVPMPTDDFGGHVMVIRPARPSLTYDRME